MHKNLHTFLTKPTPSRLIQKCPSLRWPLPMLPTMSAFRRHHVTNPRSYRGFSPGTTHRLGCLFRLRFWYHSHWIQWTEFIPSCWKHEPHKASPIPSKLVGWLIRTHHDPYGSWQPPGHSYSKSTLKEHLGSTGRSKHWEFCTTCKQLARDFQVNQYFSRKIK